MTGQVAPATHEARAWLYYAPVETDGSEVIDYDGLDPYWALSSLFVGEFDGYRELQDVEINGETWDVRATYKKSGFQPRPQDDVGGDRLYELQINAKGRGERKCDYRISPRFPEMRNSDGEETSTAFDHSDPDEGLSVDCQSSNLRLDEIPALLPRFIFELADSADVGLYHGYFEAPFGGRVSAVERYVRLTRTMNEKVIANGGVLDRLSMHLSDVEGTKGEYKWDNEKVKGHHHVLRHGSASARQMASSHRLGGQVKSYLPEHPEHFGSGDPLYHPKLGTKYVAGRTAGSAVAWEDRDEIRDELDERLLSILTWADVPTEAGGTTYVADDHFTAQRRASARPIHENPLPRIEAEQGHILRTVLNDMTESDEEMAGVLATDGGKQARDLADSTGYSLSTVYRFLQRLDDVVASDNGYVEFISEKLRQEVREIVSSAEHSIESAGKRAAHLFDMDVRGEASSAFDRWLAKYGAEFVPPEENGLKGDSPIVRIDTVLSTFKSRDRPQLSAVLDEMIRAWKDDGGDPSRLKNGFAEVPIDGDETTVNIAAHI